MIERIENILANIHRKFIFLLILVLFMCAVPPVYANSITTTSPEGIKHKTPLVKMWSAGKLWGFLAEVNKPEESIFYNANITPKRKEFYQADQTTVNIVRRVGKETVELGVGTKVQLIMSKTESGETGIGLIGQPGSKITLQPGVSIIWKDMEITSENKPITFTVGRMGNERIISNIEGGALQFIRMSQDGKPKVGKLVQTDNGVVEEPEGKSRRK